MLLLFFSPIVAAATLLVILFITVIVCCRMYRRPKLKPHIGFHRLQDDDDEEDDLNQDDFIGIPLNGKHLNSDYLDDPRDYDGEKGGNRKLLHEYHDDNDSSEEEFSQTTFR